MSVKQFLKKQPKLYSLMLRTLGSFNYFEKKFRRNYQNYELDQDWIDRIKIVKSSADNLKIEKVNNAGSVHQDHQLMHNGLKISLGSYYNYGITRLLVENEGVHEPQEEYVFQEVLKKMKPGATMLELGSYWAFYSMWFKKEVKDAKCYMIEPDPHKMNFGKQNFKRNGFEGVFDYGFIADALDLNHNIPTINVDYIIEKNGIDFLDMLHSDIQGFELKMLKGAKKLLAENKVGYVFISTHSQELHRDCLTELGKYDLEILCDADLEKTYSWDGLIVAKSRTYNGISPIEISKRQSPVT